MIKYLKNIFSKKQQVENIEEANVLCDCCNDYGYIVITFAGHTAKLLCPRCNSNN